MEKIIVVGVCIKSENDELLMVQEAWGENRGLYNFPAGRLDDNETIFEGAIREAKEETGYDVKLDSVLGIYYFRNILKITFNASIVSGEVHYDENEIMNVRWVPIEEIENMTPNELRSFESNKSIAKNAKNNRQIPLEIIENIK